MMQSHPTRTDLEFEREVTRRRLGEQHTAEAELTAAISRTETLLASLRTDLEEQRKKREQSRGRIEAINRQLSHSPTVRRSNPSEHDRVGNEVQR